MAVLWATMAASLQNLEIISKKLKEGENKKKKNILKHIWNI